MEIRGQLSSLISNLINNFIDNGYSVEIELHEESGNKKRRCTVRITADKSNPLWKWWMDFASLVFSFLGWSSRLFR